jgi:hypothetical protein
LKHALWTTVFSWRLDQGLDFETATTDDWTAACENEFAVRLIRGSRLDTTYLSHLRNDFPVGNDKYQTILAKAYNIFFLRQKNYETRSVQPADGMAFTLKNIISGSNAQDRGASH